MKNSFAVRLLLSLVACATLVSCEVLPASAQPAVGGAPTAQEPPETPVDIDPKAQKALENLLERYQNLRSYADTTTVSFNGNAPDVSQSAWERPNKGYVVRKQSGKVWRAVSDGTTLWALNPDHPGYYLQRPTEANRVFPIFMESDAGGPGMGFIQGDFIVERLKKDGLKILRFQGEEKVGAVQTRLVTAQLDSDDGATIVMTCYIGVEDGLLYQVSQDYAGGRGNGMKIVETHTEIQLNPTLAPEALKFTPPAGLKPIDYYSTLEPRRFDPLYKVGDLLPPFEAAGLDGKKVDLATYGDEGKVVLLHFFQARNGQYEVEAIKRLLEQYPQQLAVIGISMDGRRPAVEKFVADNTVTWPVVFDGQGWNAAVATTYGVRSLSTSFLIGRDSRLVYIAHYIGGPDFDEALAKALKAPK